MPTIDEHLEDFNDKHRFAKIQFEIDRALIQEEISFGNKTIKLLKEAFEAKQEVEIVQGSDDGEVKF